MLRPRFRFFLILIVWLTLGSSSLSAQPAAELEGPVGGWNYSGLTDRSDKRAVAYPTPLILVDGEQSGRSLIKGKLKNLSGARQPHRLSVNGNPLSLYTDEDGRFLRPYAFGAGSNSVEVRSSDGKSLKRVQFYEANTLKTPAPIRVVLGWDDPAAELDLHVITPDGQHAFWASPILRNGGGLDPDSVNGPGPEMFTMTAPMRGTYLVYVNFWGNLSGTGYNFDAGGNQNDVIVSQISLVFNENTPDEKRETFVVPLRGIGDLILVKTFNY